MKNYRVGIGALTLIFAFTVFADDGLLPFLPRWQQGECARWGDSLVIEEAFGRLEWAKVCAPDGTIYYKWGENHTDKAGNKRPIYPVFGVWNEHGKALNPNQFRSPTIMPKSENDCEVPPNYTLIGLCEALLGG